MCHGIRPEGRRSSQGLTSKPLTVDHLDRLIGIVAELGFESITYDNLDAWRNGSGELPERPVMLDFDHPVKNIRYEVHDTLAEHGFAGNLFMYTRPYDQGYDRDLPEGFTDEHMTWDEIGEIREAGWHVGAHTVSHPNLSELSVEDPTGERLRQELDRSNETIRANLGFVPKDFAFTGTSWSSAAEAEVKSRYRFGRLWIIGSMYEVDGKPMRFAELVGAQGSDEEDGGPSHSARYITRDSDPYRLPSMEIQYLIHSPDAFRAYLEGALELVD